MLCVRQLEESFTSQVIDNLLDMTVDLEERLRKETRHFEKNDLEEDASLPTPSS